MIKVAPSILAADFANLERELQRISTADYVHVDVMDGMFVPNFSVGTPVVAAMHRVSPIPLDVHLMIEKPIRYVEDYAAAGADQITIHLEADTAENTMAALSKIHACGKRAGIVIKPMTSPEAVLPYLDMVQNILVMTVEPGFGGQAFLSERLCAVRQIRQMLEQHHAACDLEVDGGINATTAAAAVEAGANVLVAGSYIFQSKNVEKQIRTLRI